MMIYIAGPISGRSEGNRPAFEALVARIAQTLNAETEIVIPHDLYTPTGPALDCPALCWCEAMVVCLGAVERAAMVFMVPDWEDSPGARRERDWARERGIAVGEWPA